MAKKSKTLFRAEVEDDDENEWVEEKEPAPKAETPHQPVSEPERYDTPEHLAKVAKEKEAKAKKEAAVVPNYDLLINNPPKED